VFPDGAVVRQPGICIAGTGDPCWPYKKDRTRRSPLAYDGSAENVLLPGGGKSAPEEQPER
jgi:hypothetical protein